MASTVRFGRWGKALGELQGGGHVVAPYDMVYRVRCDLTWPIDPAPVAFLREEPMITLTVVGVLLLAFGFGGNVARADTGYCHSKWTPNVTYYAPYPLWFPQYFGPPYTDYQVVQYHTSPAETAAAVKARIQVINAANPAMLPIEPLPAPKQDTLPPAPK